MYKLVINGGTPLKGSIKTSGSKNATLPIFFSSILADGPLKLSIHLSSVMYLQHLDS